MCTVFTYVRLWLFKTPTTLVAVPDVFRAMTRLDMEALKHHVDLQ
jgi:hypothetical protein